MIIPYPANAETIGQFLANNENRYIDALREIKDLILKAKHERKDLSCIYNLYSRGDKQGNSELKHANKIRLKFDQHCQRSGLTESNVFETPDIVGITVSVTYPSDINIVCAFLDGLCTNKLVFPEFYDLRENEETNKKSVIKIITLHGSVKHDRGYHACHYHLRINATPDDPIVEVQVKTVLHDAWGLKTHDLTYKNPFPIDENTSTNFSLLGDALSNLDMQSDFLRQAIQKSNAFREAKKRALRIEMIMHGASNYISIPDIIASSQSAEYVEKLREIVSQKRVLNIEEIKELRKQAISFCANTSYECGCTLLCALGAITGDHRAQLDAIDRITIWETREKLSIVPRIHKHLANFYFGKIGDAINAAEEALNKCATVEGDKVTVARYINSINSSLSYYHAALIATDEGNKRDSHKSAIAYREKSKTQLRDMNIIDDMPINWPQLIGILLDQLGSVDPDDHKLLSEVFNVIDNAIFVEIQTANNAHTVREALKWLDDLKSRRPECLGPLAELSYDLHTHYARVHLLELEAQEADSA